MTTYLETSSPHSSCKDDSSSDFDFSLVSFRSHLTPRVSSHGIMEGSYINGVNNGEKRFWHTRLVIIIALSIVIIFCSYATTGNIFLKTQLVNKLLQHDSTATIIYTNNPQIELEINKIRLFLYVDVALKALLLIVCFTLIVVVSYALKMKAYVEEEGEGLLHNNPKQRVNSADASINQSPVTSDVVKEGIVYEPYTDAMLTTIANDETSPPFNRVSNALYTYGPIAAHKMLFMLEKKLAPDETQYLLKTLSERK